MALITIGIPVYNEERFLAKTIESAINQQFQDLQIIITDNYSTDRSYEIAQHYAQKDARITVIRHPENIGILRNFIYGLQMANTKYFAWLGAHDIFTESYLQETISFLEKHDEVVMAYPRCQLIGNDDETLDYYDPNDYIDTEGLQSVDRVFKVIDKLFCCSCFHGVFRTGTLRQVPFEPIISSDRLLLFMLGSYGHIRMMDILGLKRRLVRQETEQEARQRYSEQGLYHSQGCAPRAIVILKLIEHIWKHENLSINEKWRISLRAGDDVSQRFNVSWIDLLQETYNVMLPISPGDSRQIIPGIVEAIIMDEFPLPGSSSEQLVDYWSVDFSSLQESTMQQAKNLVENRQVRLLEIDFSNAEEFKHPEVAELFDYLRSHQYQCYGINGGTWEPITHPQIPYLSYIAIPDLTSHIKAIVLSMSAQLNEKQAVIEGLDSALQQHQNNFTELEQYRQSLQIELQTTQEELGRSQKEFQQMQQELLQAQSKLKNSKTIRQKLRKSRQNLNLTRRKLKQSQKLIQDMENSKFWRLQKLWSSLKRKILRI
jgi:glycosyltransferase involved in cell wall biosynthesis/Skp family chaperone for outer membrane proteins